MSQPEPDRSVAPRVELCDPEPTELSLLREVQKILLKHPVAAQAAFTGLVAEGRRFGSTAEGRVWRTRLVSSSLLHQARLVFDLATLGILDEHGGDALPSSYLDALFMAAAGGESDALLNQLFWSGQQGTLE